MSKFRLEKSPLMIKKHLVVLLQLQMAQKNNKISYLMHSSGGAVSVFIVKSLIFYEDTFKQQNKLLIQQGHLWA